MLKIIPELRADLLNSVGASLVKEKVREKIMMKQKFSVLSLTLSFMAVVFSAKLLAASYTITDLGTLGGTTGSRREYQESPSLFWWNEAVPSEWRSLRSLNATIRP